MLSIPITRMSHLKSSNSRNFWAWINMMFNRVDSRRVAKLGPDRVAAEWLLRNGACVKFVGSGLLLCDYNALPPEEVKFSSKIKEIVGNNAGINSIGFEHLKGLTAVDRVRLENCTYIEDEALSKLQYIKDTLLELEIIGCQNVTDFGLMQVLKLEKLKKFRAENLPYVKDAQKIEQEFKAKLPKCEAVISV